MKRALFIMAIMMTALSCGGPSGRQELNPPVAEQIEMQLIIHGDTRIDPFYWMNDRENPSLIRYLEEPEQVYYEADDTYYYIGVSRSKDNRFIMIYSNSTLSNETWLLESDRPDGAFRVFQPREPELRYQVYPYKDSFYVLTNYDALNFRLMKTPVASTSKSSWREKIAHGLLVGAVANMAPELFKGIIAGVPFVDVVTTMLDETIPLTTAEYDEWGNPNIKEYYDYMLSYSPYDNVTTQDYPNMYVTSGLHDSQVQYWEPTKWVARLRLHNTGESLIVLDTNMEAGHGGASGRFSRLREIARQYAFMLDLAGKS